MSDPNYTLELADKLSAASALRLAMIDEIADLRAKLAAAEGELSKLKAQSKIDNEGNQDWINSLCEQLCKMEDALGFKNDCYDKQGKWVPTIGPWMERLRDLLATEGEVGDLKVELSALRGDKARLKWILDHGTAEYIYEEGKNQAEAVGVIRIDWGLNELPDSLLEAIDSARKE